MRRVCAWCKKDMGIAGSDKETERVITHSICGQCANTLFSENSIDPENFLNNLPEPVMVVDNDVVALTANSRAIEVLGKELPEMKGLKGGDIIECIHAHEPGGCGNTIHCSGCAIRHTVTDTFKTGKSHIKVPASADIPVSGKPSQIEFLISTEKLKGVVLLRIDKIGTPNKT